VRVVYLRLIYDIITFEHLVPCHFNLYSHFNTNSWYSSTFESVNLLNQDIDKHMLKYETKIMDFPKNMYKEKCYYHYFVGKVNIWRSMWH